MTELFLTQFALLLLGVVMSCCAVAGIVSGSR